MLYPTMDQLLSKKTLGRAAAALNATLLLLLLSQFYHPFSWLAHVMPGGFSGGIHSTGLWLFLALMLLAGVDERRVARVLSQNAAITREALETCLAVLYAEAAVARKRIAAGRAIILLAAAGLVFAFTIVCVALVHAPPRKPLFTTQSHVVDNATVTNVDVWRFTADQIAGALALDVPELYDFHFGALENNIHSRIFTDFVFAFRAILGWVALTSVIVTIRDWRSRPKK